MNRRKAFAFAFLSAVLLGLAYPPAGFGFLAWVALIPLFFIVEAFPARRVFLWSWISGVCFFLAAISWIRHITWAGMILTVLVMAVFHALPFAGARVVRNAFPRLWLIFIPFAVAGLEWARSFDPLAFPWAIFGNSQASYPGLIQFADITSAFGISWWVVMINVVLYSLVKKRTTARWVFLGLLFLVPLAYSQAVIHSALASPKRLTITLVQGNVGPEEKWDENMVRWNIDLYRSMSLKAMSYRPDLFVWPETAIPAYVLVSPYYRRMIQSLADSTGVPILTGLPSMDLKTEETWNSAGLFLPGGCDVQRYDKIHLVPFGEAFPLDDVFPGLRKIELGQANWCEGKEPVVFTSPTLPPFHVAICFESIFPDLNRAFIRKGSEFITVITNDVWFGPKSSPVQHAMISVLRAIEFHRPVVRCANTGISMIVDPCGRIERRTETFVRTTLTGTITPRADMTFYARFGNVFSVGCVLFALCIFCPAVYKRWHQSAGGV